MSSGPCQKTLIIWKRKIENFGESCHGWEIALKPNFLNKLVIPNLPYQLLDLGQTKSVSWCMIAHLTLNVFNPTYCTIHLLRNALRKKRDYVGKTGGAGGINITIYYISLISGM